MQITWKGQFCFEITTNPVKNSQIKIIIDPFSQGIGLKIPKLEADILLITHNHSTHNNLEAVRGNPFLISGPGEYEIKNVFIFGIPGWNEKFGGEKREENTIYTIESEDLKLCHLGNFDQKELSGEQLEKIGEVDILFIPVGGASTIDGKEAIKIMSQIEPKITIPMYYALPKLKIKLDPLDKFLKVIGLKSIEPLNKLSIKKKDLSEEEAKIIVLKP